MERKGGVAVDTDLISKKDLLTETGISYGQLYRWKRKGLIPEEWFVRKSTFTGQETFFPRDRMVSRVERILSMKDEDLTLDDIAEAVTPDLGGISLTSEDAVERGVITAAAAEVFAGKHPDTGILRFGELLSVYVVDAMLRTGDVSVDESRLVLDTLESRLASFEGRDVDVVVVRKMGVALCALVSSAAEIRLDEGTKLIVRTNLRESTDALGVRLR